MSFQAIWKKEKQMAMITRFIKLGKRNAKHAELLRSKGYEVKEMDGVLEIQASKVIEGTVDLSTKEKATEILADVIAKKAVFSYKTIFKFADGKELFSVLACAPGRLGRWSMLVTKGEETAKHSVLDDIFAAL